MKKQKIIIDTDPGKDDVLAIMLATLSGRLETLAVTTVAGNCGIQNVTNNARFVLDLLGEKTSLYSGSSAPLRGKLKTGKVMGDSGLEGVIVSKMEPLNSLAVPKIGEIIRANPGQVTILAIGPLTNIAKAFEADPELPSLTQSIVMMGGALSKGNTNRVAEFNFFTDPDAADLVFKSDVKKVLIPLDLCYTVPLSRNDFRQLEGTPYFQPLYALIDSFITYLSRFEGQDGAIIYDALAAYYLLNPEAFSIMEMDIQIETVGTLTKGMCVVETRPYIQKKPNVLVALDLDRDKFKQDFFKILKNQ